MNEFHANILAICALVLAVVAVIWSIVNLVKSRKAKQAVWRRTNRGAGIIPYTYNEEGEVVVFFGMRKDTVDWSGKLALPAGFSDLHLADHDHPEWNESLLSDKCLIHNPVDTAVRETREEAGIRVDAKRLEPAIWDRSIYVTVLNEFFDTILFPYKLNADEVKQIQSADTDEMHQWRPFTEKQLDIVAKIFIHAKAQGELENVRGTFAYPHEYEAVKLLFEKLRRERNT